MISYDITYGWTLKHDTRKLIDKTESQTQNKLLADNGEGLEKGEGKDWVWDWQVQTVSYSEWTSNKVLPYSTVIYIQLRYITESPCYAAEIDTTL